MKSVLSDASKVHLDDHTVKDGLNRKEGIFANQVSRLCIIGI